MLRVSNRWFDYYGEDPVDRTSTTRVPPGAPRPPGPGPVTVGHVVPPIPPWRMPPPPATSPGFPSLPTPTDDSSNSPVDLNTFRVAPEVPAKVVSQQSGMAPFETLYYNLNLEAIPSYNFWEKDEETTTRDRGNLSAEELPRYIKLVWDEAPDVKDPAEFQKRRMLGYMPDARDQFIELSPFGFGAHAVVGTLLEGIPFTPAHLQPSNFEQNARQISNGYVFTGIVESVISVKSDTVVIPPKPSPNIIDEDNWLLDHNRSWGIPYNEINSALWRRKSSVFGFQQLVKPSITLPVNRNTQRSLFNGQFGLNPGTRSRVLDISCENASSPSISSVSNTAAPGYLPYYEQKRLLDQFEIPELDTTPEYEAAVQQVKAKFIHTNFEGVMQPERINTITTSEQAESVIAMAPVAANLAVYAAAGVQHYGRQINIPSFNAPAILKPIEYMGYVIEKYEQKDGSYSLVDTFYIPGREYDNYIDAKVKYGVSYRYRIRSVVRWCRPHGVGILGSDPTRLVNMNAELATLTPNDVSYFGSEWGKKWAYATLIDRMPPAPPDEFTVRSVSYPQTTLDGNVIPPHIEVTMKLPYNPQMDINKMILYRKLQDQDGIDLTGWVQIQEFNAANRQGTRHIFVTKFDHDQDDVTGTKFNISETEKVETFAEFAPINSRFSDFDVKYYGQGSSYRYVYAGQCVTRHGEESLLSDQLGARLNFEWKKHGEYRLDFISCAGVNKDFDTGIFGTYPERRLRSEVISRFDNKTQTPAVIGLRGQERTAQKMLSNANYVMRVESLDNGQSFDVPVTIVVTTLPEISTRLPYYPFIPWFRNRFDNLDVIRPQLM